jgi:hypothetical protein
MIGSSRIFARSVGRTMSRNGSMSKVNTSSASSCCLRQSIRRTISKDLRSAAVNEVNSLRLVAVITGPEANIPRGWDDGIEDDDGG